MSNLKPLEPKKKQDDMSDKKQDNKLTEDKNKKDAPDPKRADPSLKPVDDKGSKDSA